MVLVNNAGSGHDAYSQLDHAEWHGWTITDTVFPSFLWIVGVAITLSLGKRLAAGTPRASLVPQILRRVADLPLHHGARADLLDRRPAGTCER